VIRMMTTDNQWHLNKNVSVGTIFAIFVQTVAIVWFVISLRSDIDVAERELIRQETRIEALEEIVQGQAILLARIDENLKAIREAVERNSEANR